MNTLATKPDNIPTSVSDRIAKLKQQTERGNEIWQPVEGDCLIGELIGWQKAVGTYGENYQILIKDEYGKVTATWLTAWLKENLRAQGADKGSVIAITFLGKKFSPAGRPYNAYSLIVDNGGDQDLVD